MVKRSHPAAYRGPAPRPSPAPAKNRMSPLPQVRPPAPLAGGGGPMKDPSRGKMPYSPNMHRTPPSPWRVPLRVPRPSGPASIRPRNLLGDGIGKDPNMVNPRPFKPPWLMDQRDAQATPVPRPTPTATPDVWDILVGLGFPVPGR